MNNGHLCQCGAVPIQNDKKKRLKRKYFNM